MCCCEMLSGLTISTGVDVNIYSMKKYRENVFHVDIYGYSIDIPTI